MVTHVDLPSMAEFVALVNETDEDAVYRLPLLEQAAPVLYAGAIVSEDERERLAEKFERWRYQRLNKFGPNLTANDRRLSAVLDLAGSKILQGHVRPPKAPRAAIYYGAPTDRQLDRASRSPSFAGLDAALDPHVPLEQIAREAAAVTMRHFRSPHFDAHDRTALIAEPTQRESGSLWRMRLYAPLYLSNHCVNHCLYCAFRFPNELDRVHLNVEEAIAEAEILRAEGHKHLLVVAGDFPKLTSTDYLLTIIRELVAREFTVSMEVASQSTVSYAKMVRAGASGVTLYQETFQEKLYALLHPRGPKMWFDWRLEAPERAAAAGMKRLGLGILLGLADPELDLRCLIQHGQYLLARFPEVKLAFSLPRIHEAPDAFESRVTVGDETFIRLYCALRLTFPTADLVLSTRERPSLREQLARICITQMSAGSCTAPGGYRRIENGFHAGEQFPVFDHRSTAQVANVLERAGFDVNWDVRDG